MKTFIYSKRALLFLWLLVGTGTVKSQSPNTNGVYNQVSIASPTAASLGKYADIPVNYHTGIPEINIPLYTVKEGSLSLPISLGYHGGGITVSEQASWVGTGWALNAGGVITRTVLGGPDESGSSNTEYGHFSNFGYSNYLTIGGNFGNSPNTVPAANDEKFAYNIYDGEPDLYTYNFNGHVGKFYFSDDRTPVLVNGDDLKIEYYYPRVAGAPITSESANIQGFIITVSSGDRYYFGVTNNVAQNGAKPIEKTFPFSDDHSVVTDCVFSSYFLAKMVSADGMHTINFTYQNEKYSYYTLSMFPIPPFPPNPGTGMSTSNSKEFRLVKNNIDGVRLTQIAFSSGTVSFNASTAARTDLGKYINGEGLDDVINTEAKSLDNIVVSAAGFCKQFFFLYDYFGGDNTSKAASLWTTSGTDIQTDKTRLKLESVQEKSCDGSIAANPWQFGYYSNFLPRRLSFAQDHWGYYNGQDGNNSLDTLIPTYDVGLTTYDGANRDAAWPAMANGLLTNITYPTGGRSIFEFEPNDVWVDYTKVDTRQFIQSIAVGPGVGNSSPQPPLRINFSSHVYKFVLDFYSSSSYTTGNASFAGLSVNKSTPHSETLLRPGSGLHDYYLNVSTNSSGTMDYAIGSVYELIEVAVHENALAGGVRIKTNTTRENSTAVGLVTAYAYRANGKSTGTLYSRPRYAEVIRNNVIAQYGFASVGGTAQHYEVHGCLNPEPMSPSFTYLKSPCGIVPMSTTQGNHLGYDEVSVAQPGNGKVLYRYYGSDYWKSYNDVCYRRLVNNVCDPAVRSQPAVPLDFDFSRGQLKQVSIFDEAGHFVKDTQYSYAFDSSKMVTPAFIVQFVGTAKLGSFYQRKSYWKTQTQVIENEYSTNGVTQGIQTKNVYKYESPHHHQLTQVTTKVATGDVLETKNKYAFDFRVAAGDNIDNGINAYNSACAACEATRQYEMVNYPVNGFFQAYVDYVVCRASARSNYVSYRRANFTDVGNAFQTAHNTAKNNADGVLKPLLQLQDNYVNPLVETSTWKNGKLLTAAYSTFAADLTLSDKVFPASQQALLLASPSAAFAPAVVSGNSVGLDGRYATTPETTFSFKNGNLIQITPRTGPVTAYLWGYGNAFPIAEVKGAPAGRIAFTSFEADSPGGWVYDTAQRVPYAAHTGALAYGLNGGVATAFVRRTGLPAGEYELTLWAHGNGLPSVTVTGTPPQRHVAGAVVGPWNQHHYYLTVPANATVDVSTLGYIWVDDVRLHPVGAHMTTYTHRPLVGLSSSSDANGQPTSYEYDALMRLRLVRDPATAIRQRLEYNYRP